MALGKRKYSKISGGARAGRLARKYRKAGMRKLAYKVTRMGGLTGISSKVNSLYRMIETKESLVSTANNVGITHNNISVILNPITIAQGTGDPMAGTAARIGDRVNIRGLLVRGMLEAALNRTKVHFRILVIRSAKNDTITTATLFKGNSSNKLIDQINTDRYTILSSKEFNVSPANQAPASVNPDGSVSVGGPAGIATRTFSIWVPGRRFGRNGALQFEDGSSVQPKFYDYRVIVLAYDWYGTPDVNVVGRINNMYSKLYFKDA